jgi:hypothetical protein
MPRTSVADRWAALPHQRRDLGIIVGVVVGTIAIGAVIGTAIGHGGNQVDPTAQIARLAAATPGQVLAVSSPDITRRANPYGIGSLHAGVTAVAFGQVDDILTGGRDLRAPDGGRLIAFRLGDWACGTNPCQSWRTLKPVVLVDGASEALPAKGDTFAVVLPPGGQDIELSVKADGYTQTLSLLDGSPGPDNIALYERPLVPRKKILRSVTLQETSSIPLSDGAGPGHDLYTRDVTIEYAELRFFLNGQTPSAPDKAFLVVNAYYSYQGQTAKYVFGPTEARFIGALDGARYRALDVDPSPSTALLGFEVPADTRAGRLVFGGVVGKTSTIGTAYTSTLQTFTLPITVRGGSAG